MHLQLRSAIHKTAHKQFIVMAFVFGAGVTALATIATAAHITKLPLLFPPLGPSAFILFYTPMSVAASPRSVILSHGVALASGLVALHVVAALFPDAGLFDPSILHEHRILAIALAVAMTSSATISLRCVHPPAAATALIAAMGFMTNPVQIAGLLVAVVLLVAEAFVFNRLLGGFPYPLWRADPKVARSFGVLAGIPDGHSTFWQQLAHQVFQKH